MKKRQTTILAGTALALLMASAPSHALAPSRIAPAVQPAATVETPPLILAQAEAPAAGEELPPEEAPAEEAPADAPAAAPEPAPAAEPAPQQAEQPARGDDGTIPPAQVEEPARAEQPAAPAPEAPAQAEQPAAPEAPATAEQPAAPEAPATAEQPAAPEAPATAEQPARGDDGTIPPAQVEEPATAEQPADPAPEAPATAEQPVAPAPEAPATAEQPVRGDDGTIPPGTVAEPQPENAAPVLDSQKGVDPATAPAETAAPAEAAPPPENDAAAQAAPIAPADVQSAVAEEGQRIELTDEQRRERRRDRREGSEVVQEFEDNRVIIEFNNQVYIESQDQPRIARGAREVYYEDLPRGRTREVVVRENGVQVVTIRNRYGDVVRRSRITPDNREYVLYYVPEDSYDRIVEWRDPAEDLPPLRLTIPVEEYILDAGAVDDPDAYYTFLDQPPVERIERIYSIDEVKRSARVRDTVRRVDLDTITFEFGSAEVRESEIPSLEGVATAMAKMLEENPAETFLIEGHTDAVGSNTANLALSDRRAEAVAQALTNVFAIPPENLATQGYGEQYLKVNSTAPEEQNRRVAIRRVTALVSPVASANQ